MNYLIFVFKTRTVPYPIVAFPAVLDPDPLVRGTDPRIRIHTKMSEIPNTAFQIRPNRHTVALRVRKLFFNYPDPIFYSEALDL
jgi:hypothetical protein